jgi:mRNA interferase RelE/StbE
VNYRVFLESHAEKDLVSLPAKILQRVDTKLQSLSENPRPKGTTKLKGRLIEGWRLKVGDYRILYEIDDKENIIRVYRIKHRREAYR